MNEIRYIPVTKVMVTKEEYDRHVKDLHTKYIAGLKKRILEWEAKKGYSSKMDAWCDINISLCKAKLLNTEVI